MGFGYVPHKNKFKDFVYRVIGYPALIRRLQAPILWKMLDLKKDDVVLDLGCGPGYFSFEIAKIAQKTVGVDINEKVMGSAPIFSNRKKRPAFIVGTAENIPFSGKTFSKILMSSVLQMVKNDSVVLKECFRTLKRNGEIILSIPTDYVFLPRLFKRNWLSFILKKLCGYPENYVSLKKRLYEKYGGTHGKAFYSRIEIFDLLEKEGFEIQDYEYSPKILGSFVTESILIMAGIFNLSLSSRFYFLFYPLIWWEGLLGKQGVGNEIIIKVTKINN